jgi:hypothetical protein
MCRWEGPGWQEPKPKQQLGGGFRAKAIELRLEDSFNEYFLDW